MANFADRELLPPPTLDDLIAEGRFLEGHGYQYAADPNLIVVGPRINGMSHALVTSEREAQERGAKLHGDDLRVGVDELDRLGEALPLVDLEA